MKRPLLIFGTLAAAGIGGAVLFGGSKTANAKTPSGGGGKTPPIKSGGGDEQAKKAGQLPGAPATGGPWPPDTNDAQFLGQFNDRLARTALMAMGYAIDPDYKSAQDASEIETFAAGYNLVSKYGGTDLDILGNDGETVIATYAIPDGMGFVDVNGNLTNAKRAAIHLGFLLSLAAVNDPAAAASYMADLRAFIDGTSDLLMDTDWKLIVLEVFLREQVAAGVYDSIKTAHLFYGAP